MKTPIDKETLKAALNTVRAVAEAIREAKQIPSGHLYAVLCPVLSLEEYEKIINMLINAGLVRRDQSHLLHWIEPKPAVSENLIKTINA